MTFAERSFLVRTEWSDNVKVDRTTVSVSMRRELKPHFFILSVLVNVLPALYWFYILIVKGGHVDLVSQARINISHEVKIPSAKTRCIREIRSKFVAGERRSLTLVDGESSHCCNKNC
jgi:hypothetical protein